MLKELAIDFKAVTRVPRRIAKLLLRKAAFSPSRQTELHFSD